MEPIIVPDFPRTPTFDLSGKRALVVGASSGIGQASALALAEHGAEVTLAARRVKKLEELADYITGENWLARVLELDVVDVTATAIAVENAGPFDILLNAAGEARHSDSTKTTPEDFDAVMNINLKGAYFLTQAVAKGLLAAGKSGSLINISSQMAHVGGRERAVYCASKHAVEGFTKAMAIEFGPSKIRVNTICPTFILTPLTQPTFDDPEKRTWILDKIKLGRAGKVEDIMGAVVYLASDASALVTGTSLMIDGGWTAD
jgi:NAD(P)-dependent dehydrogenase (short-subunit alcohol dehydrogenase family)